MSPHRTPRAEGATHPQPDMLGERKDSDSVPVNAADGAVNALRRFMDEATTFYSYRKALASLFECRNLVARLPDSSDTRKVMKAILLAIKDSPLTFPKNPDNELFKCDPDKFNQQFKAYLRFVKRMALHFEITHKRRLEKALLRLEVIATLARAVAPTIVVDDFPELKKINKSARAMLQVCMLLNADSEPATFSDIEDCLKTSNTTNKNSRKVLVDCGLLTLEGLGPDSKWRVTKRGVLLSKSLE